ATRTLDVGSATQMLRETAIHAFMATLGLIVAITGGSFVMAALQARGVMSIKPITPQWSRIDPATNIKNLLGFRPVVELLKSLGKLLIVGITVYMSIKSALPDAVSLSQTTQLSLLLIVKKYAVRMLATAGGAYLVLAGGDYVWQWWRFEQSIRMTKEEV